MTKERALKKPVPKSFKVWERELLGILRFLAQMPKYRKDNGNIWAEKQCRYYEERFDVLANNPPRLPPEYKIPKRP